VVVEFQPVDMRTVGSGTDQDSVAQFDEAPRWIDKGHERMKQLADR
jgi:hypothetical protein